jgi:hypothetical protein
METLWNTWNDWKNLVIEVLKTHDLANSLQTWELKKELIWKEDAIIKDLKENCVRPWGDRLLKKSKGKFILKWEVKKKDPYDWLKWRIIEVGIPTVENFIWSSSSYFISDSEIWVQKWDFESGWFETIACSVEDVTKFLESIRTYFGVYWVKIDENIDYENDLWIWNDTRHWCLAGTIMKQLLNLRDGTYWLWDLDEDWKRIKLTIFGSDWLFYFQKANKDYVEANVLAKLNCLIEE